MTTSEILRGNAVDLITGCDFKFDLIVTDPPYALNGEGLEHGISASVAIALRESAKKLKRGSWMVVFSASSWRSTIYMVESLRGIVEPVRLGTWVKPKSRTKVRTPGWLWASVNAIAFRKGPKNRPDLPDPIGLDWIECPPLIKGRRAQLPDKVADWSVSPFVVPGGLAFDPFSGSGALLKAAEKFDMNTLGFEVQGK